jgi:hypothetical protein
MGSDFDMDKQVSTEGMLHGVVILTVVQRVGRLVMTSFHASETCDKQKGTGMDGGDHIPRRSGDARSSGCTSWKMTLRTSCVSVEKGGVLIISSASRKITQCRRTEELQKGATLRVIVVLVFREAMGDLFDRRKGGIHVHAYDHV